ncbi:glycosyltransferase [Halanaerobium congolense]|uniref:Glycosyltransferase involved in cell wall bisynthesis n=1 Tax=Halanaerobium congolense TaxID=54121 RepID=A0A1G6MR03_9FIRM|nr:glycosyltransferase [Halanaerobium congolense]SDC57654.1 Glycosyltransferase involved in cell wall bisynthesis [Halanaerobium congolense]
MIFINILQLNTFYDNGGAAQISRTLYKKIREKINYDAFFSYGRGNNKGTKLFKFTYKPEVYLHGLITRLTGYEGIGSYFSTKKLIKYIENNNINLIHLHNIHGYYLDLNLIKYFKKNSLPVVWTFHDPWPFTGSCAYISECNRWQIGCGKCPHIEYYPTNYVDQSKIMWKRKRKLFSSGWEPIIVTPSKWLADKVKISFLKDYKIKVINNGININIFRPRDNTTIRKKLGISSEKKVILFVAADLGDKRKGARYFFEALSYLKNEDYMVVTIGKKYKKQFKDIDIDIKQLGYIFEKVKLSEIYSMSDLFCITSLDDNFPTTVLESLASGTTVVGFNVGGIPEQISGDCGILVESRQSKELSKKIKLLLEDDKLNEEMSKNAREKAVNNYSVEKMVNGYIKVYDELLEEL